MYSWTVPHCPSQGLLNPENGLHTMILASGNANNDTYRHTILEQIKFKYPNTAGISTLLGISERYAQSGRDDFVQELLVESKGLGETGYLGGYFWDMVWPRQLSKLVMGFVYPPEIPLESPLYPIWCYFRGRMVSWCVLENAILSHWMYR